MNVGRAALIAAGAVVGAPLLAAGGLTVRALLDHEDGDRGGQAPEAANGITTDWRSHLPGGIIRSTASEVSVVASAIAKWIRHDDPAQAPSPTQHGPLGQALASWQALETSMGVDGDAGMYRAATGTAVQPATVWPLGQALNAALDVASRTGDYHDVNEITRQLSIYQHEGAYSPGVWTAKDDRLWDDNAWIALDLLQAWRQTGNRSYVERVEQMMPFLERGIREDGGVWWQENNPRMSVNTCSTAPMEQVMLGMYEATGDRRYLDTAKRIDAFLTAKLQRADGLYIDNLGVDGSVGEHVWAYNQGTPIGAAVQLYRATGDRSYLDRAQRTADAVVRWARQGDTLWKQPPAFTAILFRNLLALDAVAPDPRYREMLTSYLDRAWTHARDPQTGIFSQGGIGRYEDGEGSSMIDQAAMVQMFAMLAPGGAPLPGTGVHGPAGAVGPRPR